MGSATAASKMDCSGTRNTVQGNKKFDAMCKLELVCWLLTTGWAAVSSLPNLPFYSLGGTKECVVELERPKLYYEALCCHKEVFQFLPGLPEHVPCIYHGLPSAYYKSLLVGRGPQMRQHCYLRIISSGQPKCLSSIHEILRCSS